MCCILRYIFCSFSNFSDYILFGSFFSFRFGAPSDQPAAASQSGPVQRKNASIILLENSLFFQLLVIYNLRIKCSVLVGIKLETRPFERICKMDYLPGPSGYQNRPRNQNTTQKKPHQPKWLGSKAGKNNTENLENKTYQVGGRTINHGRFTGTGRPQGRPGPTSSGRHHEQHHGPRQDKNPRTFCVGYKFLGQLTVLNIEDIIKKLEEKKDGLLKLVQEPIEELDIFVLLLDLMAKLTKSSFEQFALKILIQIVNSNFMANLRLYLIDLPEQIDSELNKLYWDNPHQFWQNFLTFFEYIIDLLPSMAFHKCKHLIDLTVKECLQKLKINHKFSLTEEYNLKFIKMREKLASYEVEKKKEGNKPDSTDTREPPESFRLLSILPTTEDILDSRPFLRKNIIEGGYRDVEHYLDVQFRLLREDCYGPLRVGINQYLTDKDCRHFDNIRVYRSVKFYDTYISNSSYKSGFIIKIDPKICKNFGTIRWVQNKRFIHGALLLLTKDNCRSFIVAIVLDRDVKLLQSGKIPVFLYGDFAVSDLLKDESYVMFESEVYFEPYYHVLKALQHPKFPRHLAMSKYIVKAEPEPKPPTYLNEQSGFPVTINGCKVSFKILQEETWPTARQLGLNDSQYAAYKMALTHEFAVIQGPPGTGKSYLGSKLALTILRILHSAVEEARTRTNFESSVDSESLHSSLSDVQKKIPKVTDQACVMLLVCYTNHALDQFLEAILPITKSIVRIGGQSRNETLTKYNINNVRRESDCRGSLYNHLRFELKDKVNNLRSIQKSIDLISDDNIIDYKVIKKYAPESRELIVLLRKNPLVDWLFEGEDNTTVNNNEILSYSNMYRNDKSEDKQNLRKDYNSDDLNDGEVAVAKNDFAVVFSLNNAARDLKINLDEYNSCKNNNNMMLYATKIRVLARRIKIAQEMFQYRWRKSNIRLDSTNIKNMVRIDRWSLYFRWARIVQSKYKLMLEEEQVNLEKRIDEYEEARMIEDLRVVKSKNIKVVGMTTSGAARNRKFLEGLAPPIVIVEEAAEVLETHIVTSLTENCKHLILIGDHQQLRPSASYMKLARRYNIEVSLFERMILNGMHSSRLDVQHRMRPEIAALISPHIYQHLDNHPKVHTFPDVRGVTKNLFFFSHNYIEEQADENSTRTNKKEGDITLAFANYLMMQGYRTEDITILATYTGQMFYMKNVSKSYARLGGIKITVVDNYQGEESRIILLSLVRNNVEGKIGFLGIKNRICVAMSRAKEGFYMFGNIDILKQNELWNNIATTLESNESIGNTLTLRCENHRDQMTMISSVDDFKNVPEGGCLEKCNSKLSQCDHLCTFLCHGYDLEHEEIKCTFKCERMCENGHVCPLKCNVECKPCDVLVEKVLPCGHSAKVPCHQDPETVKCKTLVPFTMPNCGHAIEQPCFVSEENAQCTVPCEIRVESCGHACALSCHIQDDPHHEKYICRKPCTKAKNGCSVGLEEDLKEHQCQKLCYEECDPCEVEVSKKRSTCKHAHNVRCNEDVDLIICKKNCTRALACGHFCRKKCHEACGNCSQKVKKSIPSCGHEVWIECSSEPQRTHCKEKCEQVMTCGHPCKGSCARPCDPARCEAPLEETMLSSCGHSVTLLCYLATSLREGTRKSDEIRDELSRLCTAPCGATLLCSHECSGTCTKCHHGALHVSCAKPCGATNVCGHICESPCNQVCPPCNKQCPVKCAHSRCGNFCGAPCTSCKERCKRACKHSKCKKRCGQKCSRAACSERCSKRLPCKHRCRGLCGEPCPDVCAICRPDSVPKDFILQPYEDDDIFIKLEDCSHIFSVEEMDMLVKKEEHMIKIPACPLCRVPIINTYRYKDIINEILENEINPVKRNVYGNKKQIDQTRGILMDKVKELKRQSLPKCLTATFKILGDRIYRDKRSALLHQNTHIQKIEILEIINGYYTKYLKFKSIVFDTEFSDLIKHICEILKNEDKLSEQRIKDINGELKRINALINFADLMNTETYKAIKTDPEVVKATEEVRRSVFKRGVFEETESLDALRKIQKSKEYNKMQRELVVRAMGTKMGHWYKCPNGHPYYIGECGGANQVSTCIECGVAVGGSGHRLLAGNSHAGEIDGSSFSAWSEQANNMNNFDLNNI